MHPEIVRDAPGDCPICGMALEPRTVDRRGGGEPRARRHDAALLGQRRAHGAAAGARHGRHAAGPSACAARRRATLGWMQLALATPVVLWGGWPFFVRGWQSIVHRSLNMFTLIGAGRRASPIVYSLVAQLFPGHLPAFLPDHGRRGRPSTSRPRPSIITLVLLGQVLELRARSRTGRGDQGAPRPGAEDGAASPGRRLRGGRPARPGAARRPAARAARREGAGGRRRPRGHQRGGRVDGHRRADPGGEERRATAVIGATVNGTGSLRHAGRAGRARTRCWRRSSRWWPRPSAAARRSRSWPTWWRATSCPPWSRPPSSTFIVWASGGPEPRHGLRAGQRGRRADHRLPLRAGARDARCRSWSATGKGRDRRASCSRTPRRIEILRKVDTLVVDKTGTLTEGQAAAGHGRAGRGRGTRSDLLRLAASLERGSEHPLAAAIVAGAAGTRASNSASATDRSNR